MQLKEAKLGDRVRIYVSPNYRYVVDIPTSNTLWATVIGIYTDSGYDYIIGWQRGQAVPLADSYIRLHILNVPSGIEYAENEAQFEYGYRVPNSVEIAEIEGKPAPVIADVATNPTVVVPIAPVSEAPSFDFDAYNGLKRRR
jgi:hypothetical protein